MRRKSLGILLALAASVLWAHIGVLARFIYALGVDPLFAVTARALAAAFLTTLGVTVFRPAEAKLNPKLVTKCILYGIIAFGANFVLYFYALRFTKIAIATTIIYTNPIFVILLSILFLKERPRALHFGMAIVVLIGIGLLMEWPNALKGNYNFQGMLFALGCAVAISIYNVIGKSLLSQIPAWSLLTYALWGGSVALLAVHAIVRPDWPKLQAVFWIYIFILAIGPTVLGYGLYLKAVELLGPINASLLATSEPVFATTLAWLWFRESITAVQGIGIACIITAIIIIKRTGTRAQNPA